MRLTHRHFGRGRITDSDSSDVQGDALSECINLDINDGTGVALVRAGVEVCTDLGELPDSDACVAAVGSGHAQSYTLYGVLFWQSGIETVRDNALLVFRGMDSTGVWEDSYVLATNAAFIASGGTASAATVSDWWVLEALAVSTVHADAFAGVVRISVGNQKDYRILMNLCETGNRVLPNETVTPTSNTATANVWARGIGTGGYVRNGWLYDAGKLYLAELYDCISFAFDAAQSDYQLETAKHEVAIVPRFDGDIAPQWSLGLYSVIEGVPLVSNSTKPFFVEAIRVLTEFAVVAPPNPVYSPRITHLDVYVKVSDRAGLADWTDFSRVFSIPFNNTITGVAGTPATAFTLNKATISADEGRWSADGDGRPMLLGGASTDVEIQYHVGLPSLVPSGHYYKITKPSDTEVDANIAMKPTGMFIRRKRAYAWGINNDPGQTRIAISARDNIATYQIDVWWKLYRITLEGARASQYAMEYRDRMLLLTAHSAHFVDLEQRIDDQSMSLESQGELGTTWWRSIVRTSQFVAWANRESIWMFDGMRARNMLSGVDYPGGWQEEWQQIPEEWREQAVAGYNKNRQEFWISVQTAATAGNGTAGTERIFTVFVFCTRDDARNWRTYRFLWSQENDVRAAGCYFEPRGFIQDLDERWLMWGYNTVSGVPLIYKTAARGTEDDGHPIYFRMDSQWQGVRADAAIPYEASIARDHTATVSADPLVTGLNNTLEFWINADRETEPYCIRRFDTARRGAALLRRRRLTEYKFSLRGGYTSTDAGLSFMPRINEITIESNEYNKRIR